MTATNRRRIIGASRSRSRSRFPAQHVPEAPDGVDQGGFDAVHLLAQVGDVVLDHPAAPAEVVLPDVVQDLALGQDPLPVDHEEAQQLELGRRQLDGAPAPAHPHHVLVDLQVVVLEAVDRFAGPLGAAQHGPDPGDQLLQAEGLGQVVVAALGEAADLVLARVAGGEEHHRCDIAVGAQPPAHLEAVESRHAHVEDQQVGVVGRDRGQRTGAIVCGQRLEPGDPQRRRDQVPDVLLVVGHQDSRFCHGTSTADQAGNSLTARCELP
jgi:hypothetical protein